MAKTNDFRFQNLRAAKDVKCLTCENEYIIVFDMLAHESPPEALNLIAGEVEECFRCATPSKPPALNVLIDAALDKESNFIGKMIEIAEQEDSSGLRRAIKTCIDKNDYYQIYILLNIAPECVASFKSKIAAL